MALVSGASDNKAQRRRLLPRPLVREPFWSHVEELQVLNRCSDLNMCRRKNTALFVQRQKTMPNSCQAHCQLVNHSFSVH